MDEKSPSFSQRRIVALKQALNEFAAAHHCPEHPDLPMVIHQVGNAWCADCTGPATDEQNTLWKLQKEDGTALSGDYAVAPEGCFFHVHIVSDDD